LKNYDIDSLKNYKHLIVKWAHTKTQIRAQNPMPKAHIDCRVCISETNFRFGFRVDFLAPSTKPQSFGQNKKIVSDLKWTCNTKLSLTSEIFTKIFQLTRSQLEIEPEGGEVPSNEKDLNCTHLWQKATIFQP
jgi:hypothetical protein